MDIDGFGHFFRSCSGFVMSPAECRKHFMVGVQAAAEADGSGFARASRSIDFKSFVKAVVNIAKARYPFVSSPGQALEGFLQTVVLVGEPEEQAVADDDGDAAGAAAPLIRQAAHPDHAWKAKVDTVEDRPDSGGEYVAAETGSSSTSQGDGASVHGEAVHGYEDGAEAGDGSQHGGRRSPVSSVAARAAREASLRLTGAASPAVAAARSSAAVAFRAVGGSSTVGSDAPPPPPGVPSSAYEVSEAEWSAFVDPRGYTYYHHEALGITQWDPPKAPYWAADGSGIVVPPGVQLPQADSGAAKSDSAPPLPSAKESGSSHAQKPKAGKDSDAVAALLAASKGRARSVESGDGSARVGDSEPPRRLIGGGSVPSSSTAERDASGGAGGAGGARAAGGGATLASEGADESKISQLRASRLRGQGYKKPKEWGAGIAPSHLEEESAGRGQKREEWRSSWQTVVKEDEGRRGMRRHGSVTSSQASRTSSERAFAAGVKGSYLLAHGKPDSSPRKRKEKEAETVYYSNQDIGATSWTAKEMNPRYDHKSATSLQRATVNQLVRNTRSDDRDFVAELRPELYDRPHVPKAAEKPTYSTLSAKEYRERQKKDRAMGKSVFERLTDHKAYTGTHKHRFDGDGRGRGMYGRDTALEDAEIFQARMKEIPDDVPHWIELNPVTMPVNSSKLAARI